MNHTLEFDELEGAGMETILASSSCSDTGRKSLRAWSVMPFDRVEYCIDYIPKDRDGKKTCFVEKLEDAIAKYNSFVL